MRLKVQAAAPAAPERVLPRAVPNHDFESLNTIGYYNLMDGATAVVTEDDAHGRRRYLQVRGSARLYPPLQHLYRLSLWARGKGSVAPGLHLGSWLFDLDWRYAPHVFPLAKTEWRQVR